MSVPLADILKEAEFRATAWDAFLSQFPSSGATLIVDESRIPASAGEGTIDGKVLMLAANGRTIDEIGLALHATEFHLYQRLYALARQGVVTAADIEIVDEPLPEDADQVNAVLGESARLLAEGRPAEAELAAARALGAAPSSDEARQALAAAREALGASCAPRSTGAPSRWSGSPPARSPGSASTPRRSTSSPAATGGARWGRSPRWRRSTSSRC